MGDDINLGPQDATPRRNQSANQQQLAARCQVERPDLKDVLTQLTQVNLTMRGEVANQPNQAPTVDVPKDPNLNWTLQKLPAETKFPVPCTVVVQRIAADLLARLPTMAARDQHDARFVLAVVSDWPNLDDEMRNITFQRLNLYTIVAAYSWPTALLHLLRCRRSQPILRSSRGSTGAATAEPASKQQSTRRTTEKPTTTSVSSGPSTCTSRR